MYVNFSSFQLLYVQFFSFHFSPFLHCFFARSRSLSLSHTRSLFRLRFSRHLLCVCPFLLPYTQLFHAAKSHDFGIGAKVNQIAHNIKWKTMHGIAGGVLMRPKCVCSLAYVLGLISLNNCEPFSISCVVNRLAIARSFQSHTNTIGKATHENGTEGKLFDTFSCICKFKDCQNEANASHFHIGLTSRLFV